MNETISKEIDLQDLALTVARNQVGQRLPLQDVLTAEFIPPEEFDRLLSDPLFIALVKKFERELTENGFSFKAKCAVMAEDLIRDKYRLIKDPDTPAASKVKAIENVVRWAGLEPATSKDAQETTAPFVLNIIAPQSLTATANGPRSVTLTAPHTPIPTDAPPDTEKLVISSEFDEDDGYYEENP